MKKRPVAPVKHNDSAMFIVAVCDRACVVCQLRPGSPAEGIVGEDKGRWAAVHLTPLACKFNGDDSHSAVVAPLCSSSAPLGTQFALC